MRRVVISALVAVVSVVSLVGLFSCEKEEILLPDRNLPPETLVTEAPADSTQTNFRVHLFWYGRDSDGTVTRFRYAIDDTLDIGAWHHTTQTDTIFVFSANDPLLRYHEFYIAAIDNEGKADPSPAILKFFARDDYMPWVEMVSYDPGVAVCRLSPSGEMACLPPPGVEDTLGMDNTTPILFEWKGGDRDGELVEFSYKLDNEGYAWVSPDSAGPDTAFAHAFYPAPMNLSSGEHTFYIRARDDALAVLLPAYKYNFVVNFDPSSVIDNLYYIPFGTTDRVEIDFADDTPDTLPDGCSIEVLWTCSDDRDGDAGGVAKSLLTLRGPDLLAGQDYSTGWMDYPDSTAWQSPRLQGTLDGPFVLRVFAMDNRRRSEGTPDRLEFLLNYPPEIYNLAVAVTDSTILDGGVPVDTVCVATFTWDAVDPDNEVNAPVKFFYFLDGRLLLPSDAMAQQTTYQTLVEPGAHEFEVRGYNYSYDPRVAFGFQVLEFEISETCEQR
ncbi:MAG: hypothetical protein KAW17_08595 [Candidatus Eisenbacteria sp.]|nr:hypothetical protein [Candidatus Eisenbacteria bacterium]